MQEEIKVLGMSGKKQSGKNTACNYIIGCFLQTLEIIKGEFKINEKGQLWLPDIFGDTENECVFDIMDDSTADFRKEYLDDIVKVYSFADSLKQDVCMKVLGLTKEQCYGTDEQKNQLTHLFWENMPGVITEPAPEATTKITGRLGKYYEKAASGLVYHAPGPMTGREVMQFVGTEIFRKMYGDVWVDATIRKIKQDRPLMAIITDVRFPNEVHGITCLGFKSDYPATGKILRLSRDIFKGQDQHESETALDNFDFTGSCDYLLLDNNNMSVDEQNEAMHKMLYDIQWMPRRMQ